MSGFRVMQCIDEAGENWRDVTDQYDVVPKSGEVAPETVEFQQPTAEQVAWVFDCLMECLKRGGTSYRCLIYDIMDFGMHHYGTLIEGQIIANIFSCIGEFQGPESYIQWFPREMREEYKKKIESKEEK